MESSSEIVARWKYGFWQLVQDECSVFASDLARALVPSPSPSTVLTSFLPFAEQQVDAYLKEPTWRLLYPLSDGQLRAWTRLTFGESLAHHVRVEWLRLRGP